MTQDLRWYRLLHLVHRRVLLRLAIPVAIGLVMLGLVVIDLVHGQLGLVQLPWLIPGILLGYPFGRMTKLVWDAGKLNGVMDRSQMVVLAVYVLMRLGTRSMATSAFGNVSYIGDIVLLITSGSLIARSLGMLHPIRVALRSRAFVETRDGGDAAVL